MATNGCRRLARNVLDTRCERVHLLCFVEQTWRYVNTRAQHHPATDQVGRKGSAIAWDALLPARPVAGSISLATLTRGYNTQDRSVWRA
jgi:hypothetical protein